MSGQGAPKYHMILFRRDVYFLATMLMADKKITLDPELKELSKEHFEDQVNRLIMLVAVTARQLLESLDIHDSQIGTESCGEYWYEEASGQAELSFYHACNKIIHAARVTLNARDQGDSEDHIRIEDIQHRRHAAGLNTTTKLNGLQFLRCCTILSRQFI